MQKICDGSGPFCAVPHSTPSGFPTILKCFPDRSHPELGLLLRSPPTDRPGSFEEYGLASLKFPRTLRSSERPVLPVIMIQARQSSNRTNTARASLAFQTSGSNTMPRSRKRPCPYILIPEGHIRCYPKNSGFDRRPSCRTMLIQQLANPLLDISSNSSKIETESGSNS